MQWSSNTFFHGQEYRRAAARAGPLSYCSGITLLLEGNLLPFELLKVRRCLHKLYGNERWSVNLVTARGTRRAGAPPANIFQKIWKFQKITPIFNFFEKSGVDRTLKFQSHFHTLIPFLPTSICAPPLLFNSKHCACSKHLQKLLFRGQEYLRGRPFWPA